MVVGGVGGWGGEGRGGEMRGKMNCVWGGEMDVGKGQMGRGDGLCMGRGDDCVWRGLGMGGGGGRWAGAVGLEVGG